jgi:Spy/CpxP family protein refolding chaperone
MKCFTRARLPLLLLVLLGSLLLATSAFAAAPKAAKNSKMHFAQYGEMGMGCAERYGAGVVSLPPVEQ